MLIKLKLLLKKYIKFLNFFILLILFNINAHADSPPTPEPNFVPSVFQQNGSIIPILESGVQTFVKTNEVNELNYGLHLIGFGGIAIDNPQSQFITDYTRMSCNRNSLEANLPECANPDGLGIYATLSPSNIFNSLTYRQPTDLPVAQTITRYLVNPFPDPQLNSLLQNSTSASDPKNQTQIANLIAAQIPVIMAKDSLNGIIARRYVDPATPGLPNNYNAGSIMQLMHDESLRRISDPAWMANIVSLPVNQLLMELLQLEAFKLWMDYSKFQQNERMEALLATLVSSQAGQAGAISSMIDPEDKQAMKDQKSKIQDMQNNIPSQYTTMPAIPGQ